MPMPPTCSTCRRDSRNGPKQRAGVISWSQMAGEFTLNRLVDPGGGFNRNQPAAHVRKTAKRLRGSLATLEPGVGSSRLQCLAHLAEHLAGLGARVAEARL